NVGGNVFTFLMRQEGISFPEAVRLLAEKAGITLPTRPGPQERRDDTLAKEKEALYTVNRLAAKFFYNNLTSRKQGQKALAYLRSRGFDLNTIRTFGLGYSLDSWDGLIRHAQANSVNIELLHKAGLIISREGGGYYDRFRARIMFPIFSLSGMVIGFGGRRIKEDDTPKYINSPETLIYHKSDVLYGLYQAKDAIRREDRAILVEGYTDLISLHQGNIQSVVATSGTALTESQCKLISRYTKNIILLYDADSAGSRAVLRGVDILIENDLDVRIAELPKGHDPDSYIREQGAEKLMQLVDASLPFLDFKIKNYRDEGRFSTPLEKAEVIRSIVATIAKIPDEVKKNIMVKDIADSLAVDEAILYRQLQFIKRGKTKDVFLQPSQLSEREAAERNILMTLLTNEESAPLIFEYLRVEEIENPKYRKIAAEAHNQFIKRGKIEAEKLMHLQDDPQIAAFLSEVIFSEQKDEYSQRFVRENLLAIKRSIIHQQIAAVREEIKEKE
ncbi:MAG: DNA primase, partial [bacterium]